MYILYFLLDLNIIMSKKEYFVKLNKKSLKVYQYEKNKSKKII